MTSPYRAMCAELVDALENARRIIDGADGTVHINTAEFVLRRARALLAQPEPEGPTDEDLLKLVPQALDDSLSGASRAMFQNSLSSASGIYKAFITLELRFARAVLAKWGNK